MRVFQINVVYNEKSTGRTCKEVENKLIKEGHEVCTAFGRGNSKDSNSYLIDNKFEYYFHNLFARLTGLQGYCSFFATKRLIKKIESFNPDLIHLRNLHGNYLNLPLLFKYLSRKDIPVIQNLHDCWSFTGKCPYYTYNKCDKWKSNCKNCKYLKEYPKSYFFDFTHKMHNDKIKWYSSLKKLTIVGVSDWVTNESRKSYFNEINNIKFSRVYNWIDLNIFKKYDNSEIKLKYGLNSEFIILGVSAKWIKGTVRYNDFMKLADMIEDKNMKIILVGKSDTEIVHKNIIHIPFTNNTTELARLYSLADVYVHMAMEDTFGKVIAEAMACETPVIVYDTTCYKEIVGPGCGFAVEPGNVAEVLKKIELINEKKVNLNKMREWVENKFNYEKNVTSLLNLYKEIINNDIKKEEMIIR